MKLDARFCVSLVAAVCLSACQGATSTPKRVVLRLQGTPQQAEVLVDEQRVGTLGEVGERGLAIPAGIRRVTVQAPGYFPQDLLIDLQSDERRQVELQPVPEP